MSAAIETEGLTKDFSVGFWRPRPYRALDHLTLKVEAGEVFGFLGPNGAGKSTTLKLLMQLLYPTSGEARIVGLAQALLNDPEVLFLDEPMSGLDPLGRRHVRDLILGLRAKGCTVFFSSHILSDAETLCSRVGVLVQGKLVASGPLSEILAFELKGWEVVVACGPQLHAELATFARTVTPLSDGHVLLHLAPDAEPDRVVGELTRRGAHIVSINPVRETLEDYFVQVVGATAGRDTSGAGA